MSRGKRFESARRLTTRGLEKGKTRDKGQLWRQCSPGRRSQLPWFISCQILSSIAISSSMSSTVAAATFSSRCATEEVPGMGSIAGECPRSQASATCDGVAAWRLASEADVPYLALLPELRQGARRGCEGYSRIWPVQRVEVYALHRESAQAALARLAQVLGATVGNPSTTRACVASLGGDYQ